MHFSLTSFIAAVGLMALSQVEGSATKSRTFTVVNKCSHTVWPGMFGAPSPSKTGWEMKAGATHTLTVAGNWNGRLWGRTGCNFSKSGLADCDIGYCVGGLNCTQPGVPPVTLAEFNLGSTDWYDISNVDGFNLPISITPSNKACKAPSCAKNINAICPTKLRQLNSAGKVVGCKSACLEFGSPQYCCGGAYGTPQTCPPTNYSKVFKKACPTAYSYAYDDKTSLFTCPSANYKITFCPS